jgi:predicted TPR repeat methyltransferase
MDAMDATDAIDAHEESAPDYDQKAAEWGWTPGIFFGLMWEYTEPGQTVLDIGIGTGLCAAPFHKAGLIVHGFDGSPEMLAACADKDIAVELKQHDVSERPWPYADRTFHHALCGGVFHFFGDLTPILAETARLLRQGGIFGCTVSTGRPGELRGERFEYEKVRDEASGVDIYEHHHEYVVRVLEETGFALLARLVFLASISPETSQEQYQTLYVARKL